MGCSYTGVCHTCNVAITIDYASYITWFEPEWAGRRANRHLHMFFDKHKGHKVCLINDDWWCSCTEKHVQGMDRIYWNRWDVDPEWEENHPVSETKAWLEEMLPSARQTCKPDYLKDCNCYC